MTARRHRCPARRLRSLTRSFVYPALLTATLAVGCDRGAEESTPQEPTGSASSVSNEPPPTAKLDSNPQPTPTDPVESIGRGLIAIQERGCANCHELPAEAAPLVATKQAPRLDRVGARVSPQFLRAIVEDPARHVPSHTMPDVFHALDAKARDAAAERLTHYLATLTDRTFERSAPDFAAAERGERLFHEVGCVACHDPQRSESSPLPDSAPFPDLTTKYSHAGLADFLRDPLATRPSARMPSLGLNAREASDIAHYLLRETPLTGALRYTLERGHRRRFDDTRRVRRERTGLADGFTLDVPHPGGDYTLIFDGWLEVERDGDYTFHLEVDDRGQLFLDDELVIDLDDRTKGAKSQSADRTLTAGLHSVRLRFFQWIDDAKLSLEWEGPGVERGPITAASLRSDREPAPIEPAATREPLGSRAAEGRQLFVASGCAACHETPGDPPTRSLEPPSFAKLDSTEPTRGCLADSPSAAAPRYEWSESDRADVLAAIDAIQDGRTLSPTTSDRIDHTLTTLDCLACHERDGVGGPSIARREYFTTSEEDLGDQAKIPPALTGVGDKLTDEWLHRVLIEGASQRPYMHTRMPRYGEANVAFLRGAFVELDRSTKSIPPPTDSHETLVEAGRTLVDPRGLQCIGCHQFNRNPSIGMQALDLIPMPQRLRREWFHRFLRSPTAFEPTTLMPDVFADGQSEVTEVLNGDVTRQIDAIWTYLAQGRRAIPPRGLSQQSLELIVGGEAVVYRGKLWEAGWRGIAVGYPAQANLAFDAEELRLALVWQGRFLNVAAHWRSQGMGRIRPLGEQVVVFPPGPSIAALANLDEPWPEADGRRDGDEFEGYTLGELRRPSFDYSIRGVSIRDEFVDLASGRLRRTLHVRREPASPTYLRAWVGTAITEDAADSFLCDNKLRVSAPEGFVRTRAGELELLVPLPTTADDPLVMEYRWPVDSKGGRR